MQSVRIDKWLWAVRLYKTRTLAAEACRAGHVEVGGIKAKPSREVRGGEIVVSRQAEITRTTRVLGLVERRVSALVARDFAEDLTPSWEYEKRLAVYLGPVSLRSGQGRPTKKQRRDIDKLEGF